MSEHRGRRCCQLRGISAGNSARVVGSLRRGGPPQATALPKSPLGTAIGYTLRNWTALTRYTDDGRL